MHDNNSSVLEVNAYQGLVAADIIALFRFIDDQVADGQRIRGGSVAHLLCVRQARGGTALGRGVLVPHAAVRRLPRSRLIYVRLQDAIDIETPDQKPVRDVLTLLVRYPPTLADHALLERIRDPYMCPILIELLSKDRLADAFARLVRRA